MILDHLFTRTLFESQTDHITQFASNAHEEWRRNFDPTGTKPRIKKNSDGTEGDINVPFADLHPDWQKENLAAAHAAHRAVKHFGRDMEKAAEYVHNEWMKRNPKADYNAAQHVPYDDLPEDEKEKDRVHVRTMMQLMGHSPEQRVAVAGFPGAPDVEMPPMKPSGDPKRDKLKQEYIDLHREIKSLVDLQYTSTSDEEKIQAKARIKRLNDRADQIRAILEPRQPPNEWQKKTYGYDDNWNKVDQGVAEGKEQQWTVTVGTKTGGTSHTMTFSGTKEQAIKKAVARFGTSKNPVVNAVPAKQGVAEGSLEEDKGMTGYNAFKREWRAKHGADAKVPAYDSKEYTSYVYRQNDKKQGVAEGLLGSDPNRGQKVPGWAKGGIIGKIGRKLDPAWSDIQMTVPRHLLSKQSSVPDKKSLATKDMPKAKATSITPTRAIPKRAGTNPSHPVTKNVVKTIADKSGVAEGNEWQGNRGNSQAGMTDHTFDEAKQYIKGNYPFHRTYNVSRVEPGMRYHANPEKVANKTQSLVKGIDSALDYLQVEQNPMMSGSTQVTPSIGYSWHTHESRANGIAVLYYEDRGMGNDTITIAAKDRNNLKGAVQVCRDAGVIPLPKVKKQGVAESNTLMKKLHQALLKEGRVKELADDLKTMNDAEFMKKYGKAKAAIRKDMKKVDEGNANSGRRGPNSPPDNTPVKLGRVKKLKTGIKHQADSSRYGGTAPDTDDDQLLSPAARHRLHKAVTPDHDMDEARMSAAQRLSNAWDKQRAKSNASLARTPSSIPKKQEPEPQEKQVAKKIDESRRARQALMAQIANSR